MRHIEKKHKAEKEVQKLEKLLKHSQERNNACALLCHRGNFLHNIKVLKEGHGSLIVVRHPNEELSACYFLPCPDCLGFFGKDDLWRHNCPADFKSSKQLKRGARALLLESTEEVSKGAAELLSSFADDEVSLAVRGDHTILLFLESLVEKHGTHKKEYAQQRA